MRSTVSVGDVFGSLTVVSEIIGATIVSKRKGTMWLCECSCGETREVSTIDLNSNGVTKCRKCSNKRKSMSLKLRMIQ